MVQKTYLKTKDYCKVKFTFRANNAETIGIHGLNNDWKNPIAMSKKKDGSFSCEISLPKNTKHEFKYLVNNKEWLNDPGADGLQLNIFGNHNSLLLI
jgi:1,4-alpha-glucan branching enzyme